MCALLPGTGMEEPICCDASDSQLIRGLEPRNDNPDFLERKANVQVTVQPSSPSNHRQQEYGWLVKVQGLNN